MTPTDADAFFDEIKVAQPRLGFGLRQPGVLDLGHNELTGTRPFDIVQSSW